MTRPSHQPHWSRKSTAVWRLALTPLLPLALGAAPTARAAEPTATLSVAFQGIKTPSGAVMVALADGKDAYEDKAPAARQALAAVTGASVEVTFTGLKPGTYAIRAFHDLNGDGKLNTNPFGIPTEPYAFSNNARGATGPPPWDAAAFEVKAGANRQTIDID